MVRVGTGPKTASPVFEKTAMLEFTICR